MEIREMTIFPHFWCKLDLNFDPKSFYFKFLQIKIFLIDQKDKNHIDFCCVSVKLKNRSENSENKHSCHF